MPPKKKRKGQNRAANRLPGIKGKDFSVVRFRNRQYVVYRVKLPNGRRVKMSWRVRPDDRKHLGIRPNEGRRINRKQKRRLQFFGDASEIEAAGGEQRHPFKKYLRDLHEQFGRHVPWIKNKEVMGVMMMGFVEKLSPEEITNRLKRTKFFKRRTEYAAEWLGLTQGERKKEQKRWRNILGGLADDLYGPNVSWREKISPKQLNNWAKRLSRGQWGPPSEGIVFLEDRIRNKAQRTRGTTAWQERQEAREAGRAFLNRPEDMKEQLRAEAQTWLGPKGMPDEDTLDRWARRRVAEVDSEGDWLQFLQNQSQSLYPWLSPGERWEDRASTYKQIAEDQFGSPIGFDHDLMSRIGVRDPETGAPTGEAAQADDFIRTIRSTNEWWQSGRAREEGFDLLGFLNETFQGVR